MRPTVGVALILVSSALLLPSHSLHAQVKPGDIISGDNAAKVSTLLSPGNMFLVKQGMQLNIVPTGRIDWPPPYK